MISKQTKKSVQKIILAMFIFLAVWAPLDTMVIRPTKEWIQFLLEPKNIVLAQDTPTSADPTPAYNTNGGIDTVDVVVDSHLAGEDLIVEEIHTPNEYDLLVAKYADKYGDYYGERSRLRATLHCLLNRESTHGSRKDHGDNGMAGGPMQFWEETYTRMRVKMITQGLTEEVGTRYDLEKAIETTAWAVKQGHGNEWGPILRGECPNL